MNGILTRTTGSGTINQATCQTEMGPASFQRPVTKTGTQLPSAIISVPAIDFITNGRIRTAKGTAVLGFGTATAGVMSFDSVTDGSNFYSGIKASFYDYRETWSAKEQTLKVHFLLGFPACTLPIDALFHAGAPVN
jgi:hypothetical protein